MAGTGHAIDGGRPRGQGRAALRTADWLPVLLRVQPALLRGLSDAQLGAFLSEARLSHLRRPKEILRQGHVAECGYLILQGRAEVTFIDVNGNRVLAHVAGPGEVLGEVEQFSGKTCAATCTTLPEATILQFDAALVLRHMPAEQLLRNFAGIFHDRLMRDNQQHSVAMFYGAEDRVRTHLLSMTSLESPEIRISQNDLAGFAGCSRQTVNRTLSLLRDAGIVEIWRGAIRVLDRERLSGPHPPADRGLRDLPPAPPPRAALTCDMPKA